MHTKGVSQSEQQFAGLLLGTAVGDSLGLPAEGLSRARCRKFFRGEWRQRLLFGRGMLSDDTEHTVFVAQCLLQHPDSLAHFRRTLAWRLRLWLLTLPAGIGFATLRSILKLWLGVPPTRSGVYSAGNGAAMRSAVIGAFFAYDPAALDDYVEASTRLTHTDPRALTGALVVARLAAWAVRNDLLSPLAVGEVFSILENCTREHDTEWEAIVRKMRSAYEQNHSVDELTQQMRIHGGVTGYVYHTVPVAVYSWLINYGDFEKTLTDVLDCGGDTDTVAAIAGALAGVTLGKNTCPTEWREKIFDYPHNASFLKNLGERLARRERVKRTVRSHLFLLPVLLIRNLFFLTVILLHGFRRLLPPY